MEGSQTLQCGQCVVWLNKNALVSHRNTIPSKNKMADFLFSNSVMYVGRTLLGHNIEIYLARLVYIYNHDLSQPSGIDKLLLKNMMFCFC